MATPGLLHVANCRAPEVVHQKAWLARCLARGLPYLPRVGDPLADVRGFEVREQPGDDPLVLLLQLTDPLHLAGEHGAQLGREVNDATVAVLRRAWIEA